MGLSATLPARRRIKSGAGSDPHGPSVGACHATGQGFPCCAHSPLPCVLPPIPRRNPSVHASLTSQRVAAFPVIRAGRLPRHTLSRPARRLLALRPVTSECLRRCRYLHHPLRLLAAGTTVAGRDSHPLKNGAFHGAPDKGGYVVFLVTLLWLGGELGQRKFNRHGNRSDCYRSRCGDRCNRHHRKVCT